MKRMFLASSVDSVAEDIASKLGQIGRRLLFVTTPIETEKGELPWLRDHRQALVDAGFSVTNFTITGKSKQAIAQTLDSYDILYMSGGNGFYLLERIQETGCAGVIRKFVENGGVYIGSSAGSYITSPNIYPAFRRDFAKSASKLNGFKGLGLVDFFIFPHWGSKEFKDLYLDYRMAHAYNMDNKLLLLTDRQYVQVEDDFYKIVEV